MDSSIIQLSKKRASCVQIRDMQVICSYGILIYVPPIDLIQSYALIIRKKDRQQQQRQQQATTYNTDMSSIH
jgi:hypothetical protein